MDDSAYTAIRRDIARGTVKPGMRLVESDLARQYGVSRTPIREALRRLEQDGLVERVGRRLRVRQHSPEEILEIYGVRVILEEAAARAAATHRTDLDMILITRAQDAMEAVTEPAAAARAQTNRVFHRQLWAASHNGTLIDLLGRLNLHLHRYPETTLTYPGRWETVLKDHRRIVDAIAAQRPDEAAQLAAEHMTAARDVRLHMYAARREAGSASEETSNQTGAASGTRS